MSLAERFLHQAAQPLSGSAPHELSVADGPWSLECQIAGQSPLALAVLNFQVLPAERSAWGLEALQERAEVLTQRLHFLLEPLSVIELDRLSGQALLRSSAAKVRGAQKDYYELTLDRSGALCLQRKQHRSGSRGAEQIPLSLTHEFFEKLIATVQDVVGGELKSSAPHQGRSEG